MHLKSYFASYSKPLRIVSDRGSSFTSNGFREFVEENHIEHVLIATHVPQIERSNRVLTPMLAKLAESADKWVGALSKVEFAMNNSIHKSPIQILFGINQIGELIMQENDRDLIELRDLAVKNIEKTQKYNERYYDQKRIPVTSYNVGDYVVIKNIDTTTGYNKKLIPFIKS